MIKPIQQCSKTSFQGLAFRSLLLILSLFASRLAFSQASLPVSGDIVFTELQTDIDDVEFITLKRLDLRNVFITDNGVLNSGTLRSGEGVYTFSNTSTWSDIPAGTFIRLTQSTGTDDLDASDGIITIYGDGSNVARTVNFRLGTRGDQVIMYRGTASAPVYIAGINGSGGNWNNGASSNSTSKAPGSISDHYTGTSNDNARITTTITASTAASIRTSCRTTTNWTSNGSQLPHFALKNILFNESNYSTGSISFSAVSSTGFNINCSSLSFAGANSDTRYMVLIRPTAASTAPADRYTCYTAVSANYATTTNVVNSVGTAPCSSPVNGTGKLVYFGNGLPSALAVTGLSPNNLYYVSVYAVNGNGYTANISSVAASATQSTYSQSSDIIANAAYSYSSNITYASYQASSGLTTSNSVGVFGLTIRDGAGVNDADTYNTILSSISFSVGSATAIRTAALFDGTTRLAEVAVNGASSFSFNAVSLTAADNASKNFELRVTYMNTVTDNQQLQFSVTAATANAGGSSFAAANAGAASSSVTGNNNRIAVTATKLIFAQQPVNSIAGIDMAPATTVRAVDALGNTDLNYTAQTTLSTTGTLSSSSVTSVNAVAGVATFNKINYFLAGNGITANINSGSLTATGSSTAFNVTSNCVAQTLSATVNNLSCNGSANGSILLTATGGTSPYNITWTGPSGFNASSQNLSGLAAGTYNVSVVTLGGCTSNASYVVAQPSAISATVAAASTNLLCYGGTTTLTVNASGGTGALKYSINGGAYQSSNQFTVAAGSYIVTIKDANNCTKTLAAVNITQPASPLTADAFADEISCYGGTTTLTVTAGGGTGALSYKLNNGSYQTNPIFTVAAGMHTVTVKDANGCTVSLQEEVVQPDPITIGHTLSPILCNGGAGTLTVNASGGSDVFQYKLDASAYQTASTFSITAGSHTISVMDDNGCVQTKNIVVSQPSQLYAFSVANPLSCPGSNTDLAVNVSGGTASYFYKLNAGTYQSGSVFTVPEGTYTVTVKDANGCTAVSNTVTITAHDTIAPMISCAGDLTVNADSSVCYYTLGNLTSRAVATDDCSANVIITQSIPAGTNLSAGVYPIKLIAADASGNKDTCSFMLTVLPANPPNPGFVTGPQDVCPYTGTGTTVTYSVQPMPYVTSYVWSVSAHMQIVSGQGTRSVQVLFDAAFTRGSISVYAVSPCGSGSVRSYTIGRLVPNSIGRMFGPAGVCPYINADTTAYYFVNKVRYASGYDWKVPAGAVIVSRPGGAGTENDTIIGVRFNAGFNNGNISVEALSNCYRGLPRTMGVSSKPPATPGAIAGPVDACPYVNDVHGAVYTIRAVKYASWYEWTVPAGATIISGQGDTSITVLYSNAFVSGKISVSAASYCGASTARLLSVSKKMPIAPATIIGPADVCAFVGTGTQITYTIRKVRYATSYQWTLPVGATLVSGQGDTSVKVIFSNEFVPGNISVSSVSNCNVSAPRNLFVNKLIPPAPATIMGETDVCPYIGTANTMLYKVRRVNNGISYQWTVPSGAVIVSGQGDTAITVRFENSFVPGNIAVRTVANCGTSSPRTLAVTKKVPVIPAAINIVSQDCPTRIITYNVAPVANATYYIWTIPDCCSFVGDSTGNTIRVSYPDKYVCAVVTVRAANNCSMSNARSLSVIVDACNGSSQRSREQVKTSKAPATDMNLLVTVAPNPSQSYFLMHTNQLSDRSAFDMMVSDASGNIVETRRHIIPGRDIRFGENYKTGVYYVRIIQGDRALVIKLIRL